MIRISHWFSRNRKPPSLNLNVQAAHDPEKPKEVPPFLEEMRSRDQTMKAALPEEKKPGIDFEELRRKEKEIASGFEKRSSVVILTLLYLFGSSPKSVMVDARNANC